MLKKVIYRLKQTPKAWYSRIDNYMISFGFWKSLSEVTLNVKKTNSDILMISLYVDDLLVTGSNAQQVKEFKQKMIQAFEMTDLGLMTYFLGMEIKQNKNEIFICQKKYANEISKKF